MIKINHCKSSVKFPHKAHCSSLPKECFNKFLAIVQTNVQNRRSAEHPARIRFSEHTWIYFFYARVYLIKLLILAFSYLIQNRYITIQDRHIPSIHLKFWAKFIMIRVTTETGKAAIARKTTNIWKKSGKAGHWLVV